MNISTKDNIIGAWRLVSFEQVTCTGEVSYPLGVPAKGALYYLPNGHVSVHIMDIGRGEFVPKAALADGKLKYSELGYLAYSGRFDIDEEKRLMTHHVEVSLYPEWVGSNQVRHFELSEDELLLSSNATGPGDVNFSLRWKREG